MKSEAPLTRTQETTGRQVEIRLDPDTSEVRTALAARPAYLNLGATKSAGRLASSSHSLIMASTGLIPDGMPPATVCHQTKLQIAVSTYIIQHAGESSVSNAHWSNLRRLGSGPARHPDLHLASLTLVRLNQLSQDREHIEISAHRHEYELPVRCTPKVARPKMAQADLSSAKA